MFLPIPICDILAANQIIHDFHSSHKVLCWQGYFLGALISIEENNAKLYTIRLCHRSCKKGSLLSLSDSSQRKDT